jgi:broad specificity phosphatase PhoE
MTTESAFEFFVVRHPPVSVSGVCYGHADVPAHASDDEVDALAARLPPVSRIWTSTSSRCAELAARLATRLGAPLSSDERLREMCFGSFEGLTWTEIERRYPEAYTAWMGDWRRTPPPGGEPLDAFAGRVRRALEAIGESTRREASSKAEPSAPPLVVTHAGVIRALFRANEKLDWDEALARAVPHLTPHTIHWKRSPPDEPAG